MKKIKYVIRNGTFETNSSSVHTITIKEPHLDPSVLSVRNGYTITHFDKFDCSGGPYYDQATKLSYLASLIWYSTLSEKIFAEESCEKFSAEDLYERQVWECLEEAVCQFNNTEGIRVAKRPAEPYIDHQSVPRYGEITFIDIYNIELVREFIFNSNIGLFLDRD